MASWLPHQPSPWFADRGRSPPPGIRQWSAVAENRRLVGALPRPVMSWRFQHTPFEPRFAAIVRSPLSLILISRRAEKRAGGTPTADRQCASVAHRRREVRLQNATFSYSLGASRGFVPAVRSRSIFDTVNRQSKRSGFPGLDSCAVRRSGVCDWPRPSEKLTRKHGIYGD